jgi:hypothetical protein
MARGGGAVPSKELMPAMRLQAERRPVWVTDACLAGGGESAATDAVQKRLSIVIAKRMRQGIASRRHHVAPALLLC